MGSNQEESVLNCGSPALELFHQKILFDIFKKSLKTELHRQAFNITL